VHSTVNGEKLHAPCRLFVCLWFTSYRSANSYIPTVFSFSARLDGWWAGPPEQKVQPPNASQSTAVAGLNPFVLSPFALGTLVQPLEVLPPLTSRPFFCGEFSRRSKTNKRKRGLVVLDTFHH
ncbi:unnamed protein product, partial [Ectocarpus sp. 12 AP-2014]